MVVSHLWNQPFDSKNNIFLFRVDLEEFDIAMNRDGSCSNNVFAVVTENENSTLTLCGSKDNFQSRNTCLLYTSAAADE